MKHIKKYENSYSERNLFDIAKDVFSFLIDENKITIEDQTEYTSKYGHERFEILFDHTYTEPRTLNEFRKSIENIHDVLEDINVSLQQMKIEDSNISYRFTYRKNEISIAVKRIISINPDTGKILNKNY